VRDLRKGKREREVERSSADKAGRGAGKERERDREISPLWEMPKEGGEVDRAGGFGQAEGADLAARENEVSHCGVVGERTS
jgi:hypothetical protein